MKVDMEGNLYVVAEGHVGVESARHSSRNYRSSGTASKSCLGRRGLFDAVYYGWNFGIQDSHQGPRVHSVFMNDVRWYKHFVASSVDK